MIKAILFDLDDTLIKNPGAPFVKRYLQLGDAHFSHSWGYTNFPRSAISALQSMGENRENRQLTNAEVAVDSIAQDAGRTPNDTVEELDRFYAGLYSDVSDCIQPIPGAAQQIELLRQAGYSIILATNPVYPEEAIRKRLLWGQLAADFNYYSFVSHANNTHFIKPNPAYYAEILARVGVEPDEAIMVGDDWGNDIEPANQLGIHTYHITNEASSHTEQKSGTLHDFFHLVSACCWLETLLPRPVTPKMIEPQYRGNIGALFGLIATIKPRFWQQHPDSNEWSPLQIICHLWETEDKTQRPRLQRIYDEDNPFLVAPREPLGPAQYHCKGNGEDFAHQFTTSRQKTMDWLHTLTPDDWYRPARHSIFGPTTLLEMAHFTAQHDRLHLNQLCQTLGNCQ